MAVFDPPGPLNERIIFPLLPTETNGIEDARFVRFTHDDGRDELLRAPIPRMTAG